MLKISIRPKEIMDVTLKWDFLYSSEKVYKALWLNHNTTLLLGKQQRVCYDGSLYLERHYNLLFRSPICNLELAIHKNQSPFLYIHSFEMN